MKETFKAVLGSIEYFLNPQVVDHEDTPGGINQALVAGKLVIIRNALQEILAEKIYTCLHKFNQWKVYEHHEKHFHYHHHNIYDKSLYPPDLAWCNAIFASEPTKAFIQRLSQRNCLGETPFSASWYMPGDHSLPHDDFLGTGDGESRQVAFVWHLSKNWQPSWGGDFFWCP